eukprot:6564454-Prymnesium_polylepis.1
MWQVLLGFSVLLGNSPTIDLMGIVVGTAALGTTQTTLRARAAALYPLGDSKHLRPQAHLPEGTQTLRPRAAALLPSTQLSRICPPR